MDNSLSIIEDLFRKIIGPFSATQIAPLLTEPDDIDSRVKKLEQTFEQHPQFKLPFQALIKSLHEQEGDVPLEEQIRFFTTKHTRSWLILNLMSQVLPNKELKIDEQTGRFPVRLPELLKFATKSEQAFEDEGRYKDLAFASGFLFDFLFHLQRSGLIDLGQTKFDEPINQAFLKAIEQSKIIFKLGKYKSKLSLEKLTPWTAFFRQQSKICLFILKPNQAPEFYKGRVGTSETEQLKLSLEMKTFGVHTGIISTYLAQCAPVFEQLGQIMSVWGFPYLAWVSGSKEIHDASAMGLLGVTINDRLLKGPDFGSSGKVGLTLPELQYLDFEMSAGARDEIKI